VQDGLSAVEIDELLVVHARVNQLVEEKRTKRG
jgi:hypothetical protein